MKKNLKLLYNDSLDKKNYNNLFIHLNKLLYGK